MKMRKRINILIIMNL